MSSCVCGNCVMLRRNEIIRTKCDALSVPSSCWQYVDNHVTVIYTSKGWMPLPLLVCTHSNCGRRLTTGQCWDPSPLLIQANTTL